MTIQEKQKQIIGEFAEFDDWMDKYDLLIELSKDLSPLEAKFKTDEFLIKACQSRVWLVPELIDGKLYFRADSDAIIVKGIIALLVDVLSGREPAEIAQNELFFIDQIGLSENLSPTRSNGLLAMVKQMKLYALAFQAQLEKQQSNGNE